MSIHVLGDTQLVREYQNGNEKAFEVLMSRHSDRVFSYIVYMVKDRQLAEDIFQDTFVKIVNTLKSGKYNEEGKFLPWVMRISHNLIIDTFRRSAKMPTVEPKNEDHDIFGSLRVYDENVQDKLITDQILKDVRRLVEYLPDEQREVVMMRHFSDMSFKEIAEATNVSINTALGRMRYALINLRRMVEEKSIALD
ncbi:MAG: sigma-70 family RNA polymerase sigma factor [Flavobacteriales bacterium]|nr:sigma-70 family RNA polymerase sigma factor [Flavobacteriales bacterium]